MAHRLTAALGIAATIAGLGGAGCGSSSSTSGAATATTGAASGAKGQSTGTATKAQFVAQAEVICHKLSTAEKPLKATQESLKGTSAASSQQTFVTLANKVATLSRSAERELRALPRPPGEAAALNELLAAYGEESTDVSNIAYFITHQENTAGEAAAAALKRSVTSIGAKARSFGMKECVESE